MKKSEDAVIPALFLLSSLAFIGCTADVMTKHKLKKTEPAVWTIPPQIHTQSNQKN